MSSLNPTTQSSVENESNERQYKCTKCGNFTFVYKSHLKRHAVVHIKENDFPVQNIIWKEKQFISAYENSQWSKK